MTDDTHKPLEWHEQQMVSGAVLFCAFTQRGRYDILQLKDRSPRDPKWHTSRMDHPLMPPFDGHCPSLEDAKRACETDYLALARADRWLDYMRDNEPPAWAMGGA